MERSEWGVLLTCAKTDRRGACVTSPPPPVVPTSCAEKEAGGTQARGYSEQVSWALYSKKTSSFIKQHTIASSNSPG